MSLHWWLSDLVPTLGSSSQRTRQSSIGCSSSPVWRIFPMQAGYPLDAWQGMQRGIEEAAVGLGDLVPLIHSLLSFIKVSPHRPARCRGDRPSTRTYDICRRIDVITFHRCASPKLRRCAVRRKRHLPEARHTLQRTPDQQRWCVP